GDRDRSAIRRASLLEMLQHLRPQHRLRLHAPRAKALARFEAELALRNQRFEIGRWATPVLDIGQDRFVNGQRQIGADEIGILERAQDGQPPLAVITVSTVWASQMPRSTSAIASRHSACWRRLPTKPGTSFFTCTGILPAAWCSAMVQSIAAGDVHCVPITSTSGTR